MLTENLRPKTFQIKGNQPLLLGDPQRLWRVKSGSLALFAAQIENQEQKGKRTYLFSVKAGEALFGAGLAADPREGEDLGIVAVALEETELEPWSLEDWSGQIAEGEPEAMALLEGWIQHLGEWLGQQQTPPATGVTAQGSHYLSLREGEALIPPHLTPDTPPGERVAWVEIRQGSLRWLGVEDLRLEPSCPRCPLAPGLWLAADSEVEVYTAPTTELGAPSVLRASLEQFHRYFFDYFQIVRQAYQAAEFERFQERERFNRQSAEAALGELVAVLQPQEAIFFQEGIPLLVAAGAVGRALGIAVRPPAQSEDLNRVKDPLDAIARASQFRTRRVTLVGDWWKEESGPLLAYLGADRRPVALLPDQEHHYLVFDPESRSKTPIDKALAAQLGGEAYVFYRPLPPFLTNALQIFGFAVKGHGKELAGIGVLGILGSLLGMVTPQATAMLVNNAIPDSDRLLLWQIGLALFAAAFGKSAFQLAQGILTLRLESLADATLQPAVWDRLLNLPPAFFRHYSSGDLVNRLLAITNIRSKLSGATQRTLLNAVFALLNLGLMLVYSWKLTLVALALTVLVSVVTGASSRLLVIKQRQQEELDGEINGLTVELINGVAKLRVAAAEERAFAAWAKKYSRRTKLQAGIKRIDDSVSVFNEALNLISSVLIFWFAILFIQMAQSKGLPGGLNVGGFLAFNAAFGIFLSGMTELSNTFTDILEVVPLWERAEPILTTPSESDPSKADPGRLTGRIALEHVTFRYREDGPLILDDVSIQAEPGEFVALVGPSGSGKSTVFRLLLGFETPLSGTVYYDGQDLAGLDIQAVRRQLGVVLQNVRVASAPIFDSIAAGALVTLDEAWEAARMAGFAEDIERMPMGMHTLVSEGGTNLSGGQKQRLLIARALVLEPKIILMDEATSALDNRTQAIVSESLDRMKATRVVIAHRLSTIRNADRIYVVEAGRVVQVGTFEELVEQEGLFARLVARQLD